MNPKILTLLIFLFTLSFDGFTQNPIAKEYQAVNGNGLGIRDIYECSNGDFITGFDYQETIGNQYIAGIMRISSNGNVIWSKALNIENSSTSCAFQVLEATNGTYYLNGLTVNDSTFEMSALITNFDVQGNINWSKTYPMGQSSGSYSINQMELLANDNMLNLVSVGNKVLILKTDDLGNIIFGKTFTTDTLGGDKNPGFDVIELMDGNILTTSKIGDDLMLIKTNNAGQTLWTRTHKVGGYVQAHSVIETSQNDIFIAGDMCIDNACNNSKPYILKLDPVLGDIIMMKTFEHPRIVGVAYSHNDLINVNGSLKMTFPSYDSIGVQSIFHAEIDYNLNVINSFISVSGLLGGAAPESGLGYHKAINTSLNESLIYGSGYQGSTEYGALIKVNSNLDLSCAFESTNITTAPFTSFSNLNNTYFENPYTSVSNINIVSQNITVTESDLCLKVNVENNLAVQTQLIDIYPNPAFNQITISGLNQPFDVKIYNSLGQLLFNETNLSDITKSIDVSDYDNGIFLVQITTSDESFVKKIIKQ